MNKLQRLTRFVFINYEYNYEFRRNMRTGIITDQFRTLSWGWEYIHRDDLTLYWLYEWQREPGEELSRLFEHYPCQYLPAMKASVENCFVRLDDDSETHLTSLSLDRLSNRWVALFHDIPTTMPTTLSLWRRRTAGDRVINGFGGDRKSVV